MKKQIQLTVDIDVDDNSTLKETSEAKSKIHLRLTNGKRTKGKIFSGTFHQVADKLNEEQTYQFVRKFFKVKE